MKIDGAVIKEQGITFAIVVVKQSVLQSSSSHIEEVRSGFHSVFPGMPIVLMAQDSRGNPKYHGRTDIVKFLANVHPSRIPWKNYTVN
jgi:hypothetical protein